jgi:hypothetical protein
MATPGPSARPQRGRTGGITGFGGISARTLYAALGIAFALLSLAAVAQRQPGAPGMPSETVSRLLGFFVEPGVLLWWLALGGPTQAFPVDAVGRSIVVAANTVWWLLFAALAGLFVRRLRRRLAGGPAHRP